MWLEVDYDALVRLAQLHEAIALEPAKGSLHAQASKLEDALGLTPAARRRLGWEIERAQREVVQDAPIKRLRVVDPRGG